MSITHIALAKYPSERRRFTLLSASFDMGLITIQFTKSEATQHKGKTLVIKKAAEEKQITHLSTIGIVDLQINR